MVSPSGALAEPSAAYSFDDCILIDDEVHDIVKINDTGKGICLDYASLMTALLRSQGVPAKLVVGYAGSAYHAWISVYLAETGWLDGVIFFDGNSWKRMDPTFASSGNRSEEIMRFIENNSNYTIKYLY